PSTQADTDEAKFWRTLFGFSLSSGTRAVSVGLSRAAGAADIPQATVKENTSKDKQATLVVFSWGPMSFGAVALVSLVLWLAIFRTTSTLLRDGPLRVRDAPTRQLIAKRNELMTAIDEKDKARQDFDAKTQVLQPSDAEVDAAETAEKRAQDAQDKVNRL